MHISRPLPYECTYCMVDEILESLEGDEKSWEDVALKVTKVILKFVALFPLMIYDSIMLLGSKISGCFLKETEYEKVDIYDPAEKKLPPPPPTPVVEPSIAGILAAQNIELEGNQSIPHEVIGRLLTRSGKEPRLYENVEYLQLAVENGLKVLPTASRRNFLEMIDNDGFLVGEQDPPTDIYSWIAKSLIIQYLMGSFCGNQPYPGTPLYDENYDGNIDSASESAKLLDHRSKCAEIRGYREAFIQLADAEMATLVHCALCPTINANKDEDDFSLPESHLTMTVRVKQLLLQVNTHATSMTQDQKYNTDLLTPFLRQFKTLIDKSGVLDQ